MSYREVIIEAIKRVKKLHNANDPYWQSVIKGLVADLRNYEAQLQWKERSMNKTEFDRLWNRILQEFFGDLF